MIEHLGISRSTGGYRIQADGLGQIAKPRSDSSPFYYPDKGCQIRPACLSCDLPLCVYDLTVDLQEVHQKQRDEGTDRAEKLAAHVMRLMGQGMSQTKAAYRVAGDEQVSVTTVHRAVRRMKREKR